jgi:hypothetical protein
MVETAILILAVLVLLLLQTEEVAAVEQVI